MPLRIISLRYKTIYARIYFHTFSNSNFNFLFYPYNHNQNSNFYTNLLYKHFILETFVKSLTLLTYCAILTPQHPPGVLW